MPRPKGSLSSLSLLKVIILPTLAILMKTGSHEKIKIKTISSHKKELEIKEKVYC
jgi:hypothetical protein